VHVGISIGVAMAGRDGTDADTLLRNADTAMYGAKSAGRDTYRFYEAEMTLRTVELLRLENNLRHALERKEFLLHYQPKSRLAGGHVVGFEALLRWQHPTRGMVQPTEFIPVLEETGMIVQVGEWVIREVCSQLRYWEQHGMGNFPVAINVSARQFSEPDFAERVKRILDEEAINPSMIELEITESVLMAGADEAIATLQVLKLLGISIAVDDFGTGYSSLSYLKRFPLDALKIDRSFVHDIPGNLDDAAITRTIISMAHGLRLKVVAEGVERPEQVRFLAEHGCDFNQGYLLSPPEPAQVWTEKYGRDALLISNKMQLRLAGEPRQAVE
jgi:EAL domain-containing protein (putative c-di-GMP-specific phosphodiesterase class I)